MGKRYVIEMEDSVFLKDEPFVDEEDVLYRVKGFKSLVFDKNGIEKLESHNVDLMETNAFKDGERKAVEMLKWLYANTPDPLFFGGKAFGEILCDEDESHILESIQIWMDLGLHKENLVDDIHIGDEVQGNYGSQLKCECPKWYVLKINGDMCEGIDQDFYYHADNKRNLRKTGNHKKNIRDTIALANEVPSEKKEGLFF